LVGTGPVFCGDAIADPLTGLEAMVAVTESLRRGGGELVHVAMAAVAASYAESPAAAPISAYPAPPPQPPAVSRSAPELGADDDIVRRLVAERRCVPC
jgi:hypothetical protein